MGTSEVREVSVLFPRCRVASEPGVTDLHPMTWEQTKWKSRASYKTPGAKLQTLANTPKPPRPWYYRPPPVCVFRNRSSVRVLAFASTSPSILVAMQMPSKTLNKTRLVVIGSVHPAAQGSSRDHTRAEVATAEGILHPYRKPQ